MARGLTAIAAADRLYAVEDYLGFGNLGRPNWKSLRRAATLEDEGPPLQLGGLEAALEKQLSILNSRLEKPLAWFEVVGGLALTFAYPTDGRSIVGPDRIAGPRV